MNQLTLPSDNLSKILNTNIFHIDARLLQRNTSETFIRQSAPTTQIRFLSIYNISLEIL